MSSRYHEQGGTPRELPDPDLPGDQFYAQLFAGTGSIFEDPMMRDAARASRAGNSIHLRMLSGLPTEALRDLALVDMQLQSAFRRKWNSRLAHSDPYSAEAREIPPEQLRAIEDETYARKSLDEMTPEEHRHCQQHHPDIYIRAVADAQRANSEPDEPHETNTWHGKPFSQLGPAERVAYREADPTGFEAVRVQHEKVATAIARQPWKYLQFHELSGPQKAAYKRAEPDAYAKARVVALGASA